MKFRTPLTSIAILASVGAWAAPYPEPTPDTPANRMLASYFERQVREIEQTGSLAAIHTADEWRSKEAENRKQLAGMLGLDPMPARTPLNPIINGKIEADGYVVEKLQFQSMPGLYVTGNLYRPAKVEKPLPTILYVCGHANMEKDGISFGNKTGYQHHGTWFARHGYVCLIIDTLQLGEIRGEHHGTYKLNKWWWVSRGYTPAGVEAWNGMRALDYLETRPEVDKTRFGVTGRSGGGAYSWWIAALDTRIKAAAPTAGITTLHNHVVDGCVEGHCDCMFMVNTRRWDYERVAALVAPRALLICNTDKDSIFPIDGVFKLYQDTRRLYSMLGEEGHIGLQIAEGPHKDTQPLNTGAFHWFERFLKGADLMTTTDGAAKKELELADLRVFKDLPDDQINTKIDYRFVKAAPAPKLPASAEGWPAERDHLLSALKEQVFHGWPAEPERPNPAKEGSRDRDGITMTAYDFESEKPFRLRLYVAHREGLRPEDLELVALNVLDESGWNQFCSTYGSRFAQMIETFPATKPDDSAFEQEKKMFDTFKWGMAYICPRGVGPTAWTGSDKAQNQRLRRFYLLGQTLEGQQVWDVRQAVQCMREVPGFGKTPMWIQAHRHMAVNALMASLFEDGIKRLDLHEMPTSFMDGPVYLNVLKHLDLPAAAALAAERSRVVIYSNDREAWKYPAGMAKLLGVEKQFQLREPLNP